MESRIYTLALFAVPLGYYLLKLLGGFRPTEFEAIVLIFLMSILGFNFLNQSKGE